MEENYILACKTVLNKFSKDNEYYSLFVLSLYGLFSKYPNYKDIIIDIFNNVDIYINNKTVDKIIKKNKLNSSFTGDNRKNRNFTSAISSNKYSFYIEDGKRIGVEEDNAYIVCSTKLCNPTELLNVFIHEMNHLIKSYKNFYKLISTEDYFGYCSRNGISTCYYYYYPLEDKLVEIEYYNILDENINTIQTTEIMEEIIALDGIVPDKKIQSFIDSLDKDLFSTDFGYDATTYLVRPLWDNSNFKNLVESNIVEGNIEEIINSFDNVLGNDSFLDLADSLDDIDELDACRKNKKKIKLLKKHVKDIVWKYNKQKEKVLI